MSTPPKGINVEADLSGQLIAFRLPSQKRSLARLASGTGGAALAMSLLLCAGGLALEMLFMVIFGILCSFPLMVAVVMEVFLPKKQRWGVVKLTGRDVELREDGEVTTIPLDAIADVRAGSGLILSVGEGVQAFFPDMEPTYAAWVAGELRAHAAARRAAALTAGADVDRRSLPPHELLTMLKK